MPDAVGSRLNVQGVTQKVKARRIPPHWKKTMDEVLKALLEAGVITPLP